jgi:hypothetical protein
LNQSVNGSAWQHVGTFTFSGTASDSVVVSDEASSGPSTTYIAVDGLRVVRAGTTTAGNEPGNPIPLDAMLSDPYPNPFNPSTNITFTLTNESRVGIRVYSVLGQLVETLTDAQVRAGVYNIRWDAGHAAGGTYVVRMAIVGSDGSTQTFSKKLLLVR